jgi:Uma2 family endonuclease
MSVALKMACEPTPPAMPFRSRSFYRFKVAQYERMVETGILGANDRVELLEGWVVDKMTQNPPHNAAIDYSQEILRAILPPDWRVREQKAVRLVDSEPEPDLAIVRGPMQRYARRHPAAADIGLIIEVADSSLDDDRRHKGRMYARARIAVYWIVNLVESQVEVYSQPRGGKSPAYRERQVYGKEASVPLVIAGRPLGIVAVRDLLP